MTVPTKSLFVDQLVAGQQFQDIFLVSRKSLAETKAGKPYLALGLMDRSGEVEARVWDNADQFDSQAEEGNFIVVQAVAKPFRDQMQLVINSLQQIPESAIDLADFLPTSTRPIAEMARELEMVIDNIGDQPLQQLMQTIFQGETLAKFKHAPAAKKMHHAYIGGLIEHTLSIVGMAYKAAEHYPLIDRDMLVAGTLLHDLAKIEEFDFARPPFSYTDRGRLVGHLVLGVEVIRRAVEQVQGISAEQIDRLIHMVLSHHGQYAYGSPVLPMTPEAILLNQLDDMDAKMNYLQGLQHKMQGGDWQWSDYQRHLERYLYLRGTEAGEAEQDAVHSPFRPFDFHPNGGDDQDYSASSKKKNIVDRRQQSLF
ncbi:MAG: 3'-5' exoribonuclease YhaM family protein [Desulfobulbus sp.]|nr:3'-5' exoribonuclease YhaM family protein [Desulfobulbus sp.]